MEAETESVEDKKQKIQQELKEMGFDQLKIKQALKATSTKEEATNFILAAETKLNEKVQDGEGSFEDVEQDYKMIFVVRMDLKLQLGKLAEVVATAALEAYKKMEAFVDVDEIKEFAFFQWSQSGQKKIVVKSPTENELLHLVQKAKEKNINFVLAYDLPSNLKTQKPNIPLTKKGLKSKMEDVKKQGEGKPIEQEKVVQQKIVEQQKSILVLGAFGPASESQLDPLTKHFKLL